MTLSWPEWSLCIRKKSKTDVSNYRPVSVLNIMSKVFEQIVFNQLNQYLVQNNLLYELQLGFRSTYSTDICLMHLYDYIRQECDKGNYGAVRPSEGI